MIRFILFFLLSQTLAQAETLTRAYFVGKDQLSIWAHNEAGLLHPPTDDSDPFGGGGDLASEGIRSALQTHPPLKTPPFNSRHFRKDDTLYDFKIFKNRLKAIEGKLDHLIYNETTGRLIVIGEPSTHWLFQSLAIRTAEEGAQLIDLCFDFLEDGNSIFSTTVRAIPGQVAKLKTGQGPNSLLISSETRTYTEDHFAECDIKLDGTLRNQPFKLHTSLPLINGVPQAIVLGKVNPQQKPLTLYITAHALLTGDVRKIDLILDADGQPVAKKKRVNTHHLLYTEGLPDPDSNRILKAYRVPPTFLTFITGTSDTTPSSDPFGEDERPRKETHYKYVKNQDPRIPSWPTDRIVDLREILKKNGIALKPSDFAAFNQETDTLFVLTDLLNQEFVGGITIAAGSGGDRHSIATDIKLIESPDKLTADTLGKEDQNSLFQIATEAYPGQPATLIHGSIQLDIESQIEPNDTTVESRLELQVTGDEQITFQFKNGITFKSGISQIVQSTFVNGKWQFLVVTSTVVQKSEHDE